MFPAMPKNQAVPAADLDNKIGWRARRAPRRIVVVAAAVGLTAGAGLLTAESALALNGSQPGNLVLAPASGASSLRPAWSTKDGCPTGYQGSAQLSEFNTNGTYASAISSVVPGPVTAFHGTLLGNVGALLGVTNIRKGQTVEFAIGCYSGVSTSGKVTYVQSTFLTLSSSGSSYSTSSSGGQSASGSSGGQSGRNAGGVPVANASGLSTQVEAALIAGSCGLVVAIIGIAWYRRRSHQ
jgi:hypothetical protein